jgi:acyl-CoA synthetase (NDP forming)
MIASASAEQFEAAIGLVGRDPNVDAVVAIYVPVLVTQADDIARGIARGAATLPIDKPITAVFMSSKGAPAALSAGTRGSIPSYRYPENAALALSAAARYGAWRRQPIGVKLTFSADQAQRVRTQIRRWRSAHPSECWLPFDEIAALLSIIGVRVAEHRTTPATAEDAVDAAQAVGYPVVIKAIAAGLLHKTDVGGVTLDLADATGVHAAATAMRARFAARGVALEGFLIQQQIPRGVEALVGVTTDASLGPLLVAGIGGVAVELYKDIALGLTPVTDTEASAMLDRLRGRALLDGFRGAPPADRPALLDVLQRISALVELMPELVELDLNPVVVLEHGAIAVDARMRLAPG